MLILKGLILIVLIGIAWQDYKFRAVYWWLFPLLALALGILKSITVGIETMAADFTYNLIFLTVQLFLLSLYFSIKERRMVNIFNGLFGIGDLFFLISIAVYFTLFNYLAYYIVSLAFVVALRYIKGIFSTDQHLKIPLAGEQSILLVLVLLATQFKPITDTWIINNYIN